MADDRMSRIEREDRKVLYIIETSFRMPIPRSRNRVSRAER